MTVRTPPRTRIKICGLTREQDVDAAVEAGADAIGFVRYAPSPRHVSAARAAELMRRLPPFVHAVLLYVNADASEIIADCALSTPVCLQFHGDETAAECQRIAHACHLPWLRAARIPAGPAAGFDLINFAQDYSAASGILLDAETHGYGGGGKTFDWSRLPP